MVPRPAATVMLLRPMPGGIGVYLIRRSPRSRFMPDAYVFPGGAVDASDGVAPRSFAVAALRELFEEAGILLARTSDGPAEKLGEPALAAIRAEAAAGAPFGALLERHGLQLDTDALTYYSNWITPESEPIRFDAHFFVARAPAGQTALADANEVHDGMWILAADALARADRNEITVRFPTRKHLERLAGFDEIDAFLAHARARTIGPVMPFDDGTDAYGLAGGADAW